MATMQQFLSEVSPMLRALYVQHRASRVDYKQAVEDWSVIKMPGAPEGNRRKFVIFALSVYDLMAKSGFDPNMPVTEIGRQLSQRKIVT